MYEHWIAADAEDGIEAGYSCVMKPRTQTGDQSLQDAITEIERRAFMYGFSIGTQPENWALLPDTEQEVANEAFKAWLKQRSGK